MAKFNEYTQKTTPEDADTLMIYDDVAKANKLSPFSGIWNWIVGKLTNAVISNLQTNNKTVLGAINELNSNTSKVVNVTKLDYDTDFHKIPDGIYSFNINTSNETNPNLGLPPMVLSDGILISKIYSFYQTLVCIGIGGIAVAQNNLQTGKFEKSWDLYIRSNS